MHILETYMLLYAICFVVTTIQTIVIIAIGNTGSDKITWREWLKYTRKAIFAGLLLSITAPLTLMFYILIWAIAIVVLPEEKENKEDV